MKAKIAIEINVPEGATHYCGNLLDDPTWYKQHSSAGVTYWNYWDNKRKEWMVGSEKRPHWLYEIPFLNKVTTDYEKDIMSRVPFGGLEY